MHGGREFQITCIGIETMKERVVSALKETTNDLVLEVVLAVQDHDV
jgi:hypothetical protein